MPSSDNFFARNKRKVQEQIEQAEREHKRKLFAHRIELARNGIRSYDKGRLAESASHLLAYINILEEWKEIPEGALAPSHFDRAKDMPELLLISGVYWDLAKMYDRTKSPDRYKDFRHYLEKYVLFSKGMPYQGLCAETVRKYIQLGNPTHPKDFQNVYKSISIAKCFVATALVDTIRPETMDRLRAFRDGYLRQRAWGRAFVALYYRNGPGLARHVEAWPRPLRAILGGLLDRVALLTVIRRN